MILIRNSNSRISNPYGFIAPAGESIHTLYTGVWKTNRLELVASGSVDLQERIQNQAPFTDLAYMIKRLKLGDNSVLTKRQPLYGDFTQLPNDGSELVNTLLHAEYAFSELPVEERKKHGYDYRSWLASIVQPAVKPATKPATKPVEKPIEKPIDRSVPSQQTDKKE